MKLEFRRILKAFNLFLGLRGVGRAVHIQDIVPDAACRQVQGSHLPSLSKPRTAKFKGRTCRASSSASFLRIHRMPVPDASQRDNVSAPVPRKLRERVP